MLTVSFGSEIEASLEKEYLVDKSQKHFPPKVDGGGGKIILKSVRGILN